MRTVSYWLLLIMILMIPWANFVTLPGLGTAGRTMGIFAGVFWLLTVLATGKIRNISLFYVFIFLFFLWDAVSIFWSTDPDSTLTQIFTYAQMAVFSVMLWDLCRTLAAIRGALQAYVLGLIVPITSTIVNFIASAGTEYALYGRYASVGNNTDTTGILLAIGLPLAWYLAASAGKSKKEQLLRLVNYAYIPAITFAIILTATRFAVIMSLPAFLFGLGTLTRLKPISRIVIFVFLTATVITLVPKIPQANLQRIGTIDDEIQAGDLNDRIDLWKTGLDIWFENPILGIGGDGYPTAVEPVYGRPRAVHNSFVAISVELGIIGLSLFATIIVSAVFLALRHPKKLDAWFWLTVLITWGLGNLAMTWAHNKPTWLLLSLLAASASLSHHFDKSRLYAEPSNRYTTPTMTQVPT
ncbi:MAG: O-antigen ligase family protein [Planctomycetota bacterium]|jgi:O-antigen ligase